MSAPRVYVPDVTPPIVALPDDEAHHVARVLRLGVGDAIVIFNGRGGAWDATILESGKRGVTATITARRAPDAPPLARVTLAVGLLKGDAMDDVMRDATALGVAEIIPMATEHVVVPRRARGDEAIERWQRVVVASAKQCGRSTLPAIAGVTAFQDVLRREAGTRILCVEPALGGTGLAAISSEAILILVGPEGGWSAAEVAAASAAGCHAITLGPFTLRAELAPVVAVTRLWAALQI